MNIFFDSPISPPFSIDGFDAEKKKKDRERKEKYIQAGIVQK